MHDPIATLLPRRGSRVCLRLWQDSDVERVRHWQQPGHRWHETNGPYFGGPTVEGAERMAKIVRKIAAGEGNRPLQRVPVADADDENRLLGDVSCYELDSTGLLAAGIAIYDHETWGRGLGTEALGLWVDLLFESHPELHRLHLGTWSGNHGMVKVAERLGFTLEARHREERVVDGARYDGLGFGILRREWAQRRDSATLA